MFQAVTVVLAYHCSSFSALRCDNSSCGSPNAPRIISCYTASQCYGWFTNSNLKCGLILSYNGFIIVSQDFQNCNFNPVPTPVVVESAGRLGTITTERSRSTILAWIPIEGQIPGRPKNWPESWCPRTHHPIQSGAKELGAG
jgi:hypothetical protein